MRALSAEATLKLPVRLLGIPLGRPVDILVDATEWRVLGLVVHCGDETMRFLAWPAVSVRTDEIAVASALMLLEDVDFYRSRSRSFRSLVGRAIDGGDVLEDLVVARDGRVQELVLSHNGEERRLPPEHPALAESGEAA
jgi:hypothetical protein